MVARSHAIIGWKVLCLLLCCALTIGIAGSQVIFQDSFEQTAPPDNRPSEITSAPVTTTVVSQAYSYDVQSTDPDGNVLSYTLTTKPSGMTINTATGVIQWTPTAAQLGSHGVTVRVADAGGLADTRDRGRHRPDSGLSC